MCGIGLPWRSEERIKQGSVSCRSLLPEKITVTSTFYCLSYVVKIYPSFFNL